MLVTPRGGGVPNRGLANPTCASPQGMRLPIHEAHWPVGYKMGGSQLASQGVVGACPIRLGWAAPFREGGETGWASWGPMWLAYEMHLYEVGQPKHPTQSRDDRWLMGSVCELPVNTNHIYGLMLFNFFSLCNPLLVGYKTWNQCDILASPNHGHAHLLIIGGTCVHIQPEILTSHLLFIIGVKMDGTLII